MPHFTKPLPLSLYIHTPWCIKKCPYCDFHSHALRGALPEDAYVNALIRDIENDLPLAAGRRLVSIFLGGGTPSLFSPHAIEKIVCAVNTRLPFSNDIEITLEANPGAADHQRFRGFRAAGVNRLSIGVQSFQDEQLKTLGRVHDSSAATQAIKAAQKAGFDNLNIDIMHGLPHQTLEDALYDLRTALSFSTTHLSWYQLTLEPNTAYFKNPPALPEEDLMDEIQTSGQQRLAEANFEHYEVSGYCQAQRACRHNLNYWEFGDYLGIGAGAHSKITDLTTGVVTRRSKRRQPALYLSEQQQFIAETHTLDEKEVALEFMMNALRLYKTIPVALFKERTGLSYEDINAPLEKARALGLIEWNSVALTATRQGRRFLNDLIATFM